MKKKIESRIGLQANNLFASTTSIPIQEKQKTQPQEKIKQKSVREKNESIMPGRPKQFPDGAVKSTVTFTNAQIVWLDRLSSDIRATTMTIIDRGAIIRAIISAVEQSKLDLCNATSEDQIKNIICAKLKVK